jgi:hypothetical protein
VTEVSSEEFQIHSKKPKTVSTPGTIVEHGVSTTTVTTTRVKPVPLPFGLSQHKGITTALKSIDSPLDTPPSKTGPKLGIFEKYDLIKKKNQTLTSSMYAQFQKQSSTAQHRLLSAFDTEKGRMHMAYLQAQVPDPKVISDYKRATFEFQAKDVHPADQMDLHKHTTTYCKNYDVLFAALWTKLSILSQNRRNLYKKKFMLPDNVAIATLTSLLPR